MATVTGLSKERMEEIEAASIVDGDVVGNNLILTKHDGTQIDAGNVRGPIGPAGPSIPAVTSTTRPVAPPDGFMIYETDTDRVYVWNGTIWSYIGGGYNPTYFRGFRNAALNAAGLVWTDIPLDSEVYDLGGNHTAAGGYVTPEDGLYQVSARVRIAAANNPQQFAVGLSVQGTSGQLLGAEVTSRGAVAGDLFGLVLSEVASFSAGWAIKLQVINYQATACAVQTGTTQTWMKIRKVS